MKDGLRMYLWIIVFLLVASCSPEQARRPDLPEVNLTYQEERRPCADRQPLRQALYGDLHVHTSFSFDAGAYGNVLTPRDAYRFARGEAVSLPPLDDEGRGSRMAQIAQPLDFLAVTDHGDLMGEVALCTRPGSAVYDLPRCAAYRDSEGGGAFGFGVMMASLEPVRDPALCGEDGQRCLDAAAQRWGLIQDAAETSYDRTESCELTTFVGYEYTNTRAVSNLHRNVIFRNANVPRLPVTYYEARRPVDLWRGLRDACDSNEGCDVMVLPHNSNLSNGHLFIPTYPDVTTPEEEAEIASLRQEMEPVVEMFQHKGDSECRNGFPGQADDPLCAFEKLRPSEDTICPENEPGGGGMRLTGCVHKLDFVRNVFLEGLKERRRLGVNPYRLGVIGSTDTHNGTPGHVTIDGFPGHIGIADDTAAERLGEGNITHDGVINNPGGLAGVWAVENSRDAIFEAMRRRETFATSGVRIQPRLFGGWSYPEALCDDPDRLAHGYAGGVPMGGSLPKNIGTDAPTLLVMAAADDHALATPLEQIQIVKGWLNTDGEAQWRIYVAAGTSESLEEETAGSCEPPSGGERSLCTVWQDPEFNPHHPAFYYTRVVERPTCRWSTRECMSLPMNERQMTCVDASLHTRVRQRAWTSPIWYYPDTTH
jgi:hypothetical protein